jgi:integrase
MMGQSRSAIQCPECGSRSVKDGLSDDKQKQRYICKTCERRFTPPYVEAKNINAEKLSTVNSQLCAKIEAKKLDSATETKTAVAVGEKQKQKFPFAVIRNLDLIPEKSRGLLIQYMAYLEREGFAGEIQYPTTLSHLVKDGADLLDPESVKTVIAQQKKKNGEPWSNSMKMLSVYAYDAFCKMKNITWNRPTYHQNEATIAYHDEKLLDLLVNAAGSRKMATFLSCLKETFADPSEIIEAEWIDLKENVLSINHPCKGHLSGKVELTPSLTQMINALPHKNKRIFATSYKYAYSSFHRLRKRAAARYQKPELIEITFKSFRHWGGSKIAQLSNGNTLIIMKALRHKSFKSSLRYIHDIPIKDEDYEVTSATTPEEILALGKAGWQKYDEASFNGITAHFYRKPKRFGGLTKC